MTIKNLINHNLSVTSYEIVCATPRIVPSREYLEFDAHPIPTVVYTLSLEIHKNKIKPYLMKKEGFIYGIRIQVNKANLRFTIGHKIKGPKLDILGNTWFFDKSLNASARG